MKALTAQTAQLMTASVTVKSLTIEGRQVTLAVFRQLQEEDIFDGAKLKGVGWGHVNYLVEMKDQINLVWQKGSELRRWRVSLRVPTLAHQYERQKKDPIGRITNHFSQTVGYTAGSLNWPWSRRPADLTVPPQYRQEIDASKIAEYRAAVLRQLEQEWADYCVYAAERNAVAAALFTLPQLFIAV